MPFRLASCALASVLLAHAVPAHAQCSPGIIRLLSDGKVAEARAETQPMARANNDAALHCMGRIALAEDKPAQAIDWLEKAVKAAPRNAQHRVWLGNALGQEAQRASTVRQPFLARRIRNEFEAAVALDPSSVDARIGLVRYYAFAPGVMGGSISKAREQVAEIRALNPVRGHIEGGWLEEREKNFEAADREYAAALAAAPPDSTAAWYGVAAYRMRREQWDAALHAMDELLANKPDEMAARYQVGRLAAVSGRHLERGEREMKQWLANPPKDVTTSFVASAHWRLGMIHEHQGNRDAARAAYQEALRINPQHEEAKKRLAALPAR